MSKRKRTMTDTAPEAEQSVRFPLGVVFHLSTLAASISMLLQIAAGASDLYSILLRTTIVFVGVAVAGSIVMVAIVTAIAHTKQEELNQALQLAREEQMAAMLSIPPASRSHQPTSQESEHTVSQ
ncbi:hypothetical protein HRbin20_01361 [bacterium HR20]|nr:hypothetical protein HRbin20_01361 [bacterium HR20]